MTSQGRGDTSQVTSQVQPLPLQGDVAGHLANPRTLENRQSNQPRILHGIERLNAARFVKEKKDSPFACYCKSEGRRLLHKLGAQIRTPGLAGPPLGLQRPSSCRTTSTLHIFSHCSRFCTIPRFILFVSSNCMRSCWSGADPRPSARAVFKKRRDDHACR